MVSGFTASLRKRNMGFGATLENGPEKVLKTAQGISWEAIFFCFFA